MTHLVPQPGGASAILTTTTYDLAGRPTQISDNTGHSLSTAFDNAKRLLSVTQAAPNFSGTRVVAYQLDPAGNKTRTTWADGYYVAYAYDQLNRMTTATENGTYLLATYVYDPLSRRTSLVYGNGTTKAYSYTTQGDLLTLAHTLSGTANTTTNTFTKAHQLASENASNAAWAHVPAVFQTTAYSAANNLNQYVNVTVGSDPAVTLGYDANGNLTGDGTWTFAYDAQNMLRTAAKAGTTAAYAYDTLGRRQAKTVNAVVTTFLHDGNEEIAEYDGANTLLRRYVPGPGTDMPIAMVTPAGGGANTRSYFHTNRQGSTIAMSADNGTISEGPYTYDAYGNGAAATGVPFKYTGRRLDPETGFYFYRARYYLPGVGRFAQTDPIGYGDQMNLYAYVSNDPLNLLDPYGECSVVRDGFFGWLGFGTPREVGLCGDNQAGEDLVAGINSTKNGAGESFDELRQLDEEATRRGVRVGVKVVDDGSGSGYEPDDYNSASDGWGTGGKITIDKADTRTANVPTTTAADAADGTVNRAPYNTAPTLETLLIHEAQHARDGVAGRIDRTPVAFFGKNVDGHEVRGMKAENRWRAFLARGRLLLPGPRVGEQRVGHGRY